MKTIVINGKEYKVNNGQPLKSMLSELGFVFPCGGQGRCGRCKITCKDIEHTPLDKRFFNKEQLDFGLRLACDKIVKDDYDITIDQNSFSQTKIARKLSECRISVSIGMQEITVSILDDEIAETVIVSNPLAKYHSYSNLYKSYNNDRSSFSKLLRNCIGTESVELIEKYSVAKADTLAIAASEFYVKALLGVPQTQEILDYNLLVENDNLSLPTDQVYILPIVNEYFGGDLLCETVELKENSLLISCEDVCAFAYIGKEENTVAAMWDISYQDELELTGIKAAMLTLIKDKPEEPLVYLYGSYLNKVAPIVEELNLTHIDNLSKRVENIARACLSSRFRAKLNKEKARCSYIDIVNSEDFHSFFANSYKE